MISVESLQGLLLEEAIARLIRRAGYRLLTKTDDDPQDLDYFSNGLQVRGRGGYHQVDVLGELSWVPAFNNPIRIFVEAKFFRERKAGMPEVRHAVGIISDVNQLTATVKPRRRGTTRYSDELRLYNYNYKYVLCSTSGFSKNSQLYALAHQINLVDLSGREHQRLRRSIRDAARRIHEIFEMGAPSEKSLMQNLRTLIRKRFWDYESLTSEEFPSEEMGALFASRIYLEDFFSAIEEIGELFLGVSSTGFVLLLSSDNVENMIKHMTAPEDPTTEIRWSLEDPKRWEISVRTRNGKGKENPQSTLRFILPELLAQSWSSRSINGRRAEALDLKREHFSNIVIFRMTASKMLACLLRIDPRWIDDAQGRA